MSSATTTVMRAASSQLEREQRERVEFDLMPASETFARSSRGSAAPAGCSVIPSRSGALCADDRGDQGDRKPVGTVVTAAALP
jgi:hypothetical protein